MDMTDGALVAQVRSREALRFEFVDEQRWDASCGYAALATLVRRYRGRPVNEESLLAQSLPGGTGQTVLKVSLAELVRLARSLGLVTRAWKTGFEQLAPLLAMSRPLLVHYDRPQGHFALVLDAGPQGVVTGDPARGLELLTREQFLARWSGVVVEISDPQNPGAGEDEAEKAVRKTRGRRALTERLLSHPPPMR